MIATRLILHDREVKSALGASVSTNGLYKAVVAVLTESCALFAMTFLLFVGPWAAGSPVSNTFFPILVQTQVRDILCYIVNLWYLPNNFDKQVIAPFLIILRVANRSSSSNKTADFGNAGPIHFRARRKSASHEGIFHDDGHLTSSVDTDRTIAGRLEGRVGITINLHHDG